MVISSDDDTGTTNGHITILKISLGIPGDHVDELADSIGEIVIADGERFTGKECHDALCGIGWEAQDDVADDIAGKAEMIYETLQDAGYEVLFDDRDAPPGVKFKDADLLGIPARVVISSRSLENGGVEVKSRTSKDSEIVAESDVLESVKSLFE